MLKVGIVDVLGIVNIVDITNIADISTDIADIGTDIVDIAMGIADVVDSADIADWMLRTLRWKQVDVYKVLWGCPMTLGGNCLPLYHVYLAGVGREGQSLWNFFIKEGALALI